MPPHVRAAIIGGAGVFGFIFDAAVENTGIYDQLAGLFTDALFTGAERMVQVLTGMEDALRNNINIVTGIPNDLSDLHDYDPSPSSDDLFGVDPTWVDPGAFETAQSSEYQLSSYTGTDNPISPHPTLEPTLGMALTGNSDHLTTIEIA